MTEQMSREEADLQRQKRIFTVPNMLSMIRIILIPVFVGLYIRGDYAQAAAVLVLSGITDMADGYIARNFNASTNLGKILDPIADKLTQAAALVCMLMRYPLMAVLFAVMFFKELFAGITGLIAIRATGRVRGAKWHGKIATTLLDATLVLHVFWYDIPAAASTLSIVICIFFVLISFVLYGKSNLQAIREAEK